MSHWSQVFPISPRNAEQALTSLVGLPWLPFPRALMAYMMEHPRSDNGPYLVILRAYFRVVIATLFFKTVGASTKTKIMVPYSKYCRFYKLRGPGCVFVLRALLFEVHNRAV